MFTTREILHDETNYIKICNGCTRLEYRNKKIFKNLFNYYISSLDKGIVFDIFNDNVEMLLFCEKNNLKQIGQDQDKKIFKYK